MHNAYFIFCDIDGINMKIAQNKIKWFMALNVELMVHSLLDTDEKVVLLRDSSLLQNLLLKW